MVFGHNLRYMALFHFSRTGFCMVFWRASFVFSCPGTDLGGQGRILEARVGFWVSRSTFWPGDLFGTKKWSRKKLFCGGMILWWGFRGIHPAQMNSMVPRTHMGKLLCPKTPLKKNLGKFPKIQKIGAGPWPIPVAFPISPWWAPYETVGYNAQCHMSNC